MQAGLIDDRINLQQTLVFTRLADGGDLEQGEGSLILDHPAVSRRHASISQDATATVITDLGSTNGTFVNRRRVSKPVTLKEEDLIEVGPFRLLFDGKDLIRISRSGHAALIARDISREVTNPRTREKERILDEVSLVLKPGRVACVVGSSGSGKSTLLNTLSGRRRPSSGEVTLGSLSLHDHFESLKQDIAFLPQSEIIHEQLTVRRALGYAARLRLPKETTESARDAAVQEAVEAVGLAERLDVPVNALSGGQRKRACLASEIIAKPAILFLDEVTSGLDESTDREMMSLLKRLSREGMSIVCVTHTLANLLEFCDDIVVMAPGGLLAYCGSPANALTFFSVDALGEIFPTIDDKGAKYWQVKNNSLSDIPPPSDEPPKLTSAKASKKSTNRPSEALHQFFVLVSRNFRLVLADRRSLILAASQSVLVGLLLGYAFGDMGTDAIKAQSEAAMLLLLGITALWMGCNSAGKEIVGELAIYQRERDMNLSTGAFVLAKFLVIGVFAVLQAILLLATCALLAQEIPGGFSQQLPIMALAAICGAGLGLLISSWCNTRDQASVIVPLALAPQLILGGGIVPKLPAPAETVAETAISAHWVREASGSLRDAMASIELGTPMSLASVSTTESVLWLIAHAFVLVTIAWISTYIRNSGRQ